MFKILRHNKKEYSEQNVVVKLELGTIFKIIGLLLVIVILLMFLLSQILPGYYFGVSKTTMILFIGSSISGVAAFCAILISYVQTREIQEENRKNIRSERIDSLKPFITLESVTIRSDEIPSADMGIFLEKNTDTYLEYPYLFKVRENILLSIGQYTYKFNLKNIGNNSAHNCSLTMNGQKIFSGKAIGKGDSISLLTILEGKIQSTEILFQLEFMDLGNNRYVQSHQYKGTLNYIVSDHTIITNAPKPVSDENTCDDNNLNKKS